jgi:hypothetical protein
MEVAALEPKIILDISVGGARIVGADASRLVFISLLVILWW